MGAHTKPKNYWIGNLNKMRFCTMNKANWWDRTHMMLMMLNVQQKISEQFQFRLSANAFILLCLNKWDNWMILWIVSIEKVLNVCNNCTPKHSVSTHMYEWNENRLSFKTWINNQCLVKHKIYLVAEHQTRKSCQHNIFVNWSIRLTSHRERRIERQLVNTIRQCSEHSHTT